MFFAGLLPNIRMSGTKVKRCGSFSYFCVMNIMQIFPGKVWGGAEQYVLDLSSALENAGHRVVYFARDSAAVRRRMDGVRQVRYLKFSGMADLRSIRVIAMAMAEEEIDLVHIHETRFVPMVSEAVRRSGRRVRVVLTRHIARGSRVSFWNRRYFLRLHRIIFVSDLARRLWTEANPWMAAASCRVVHNSIPPLADGMDCEPLRQHYGIPEDVPLLVFTGRVRRSKGCAVLVEALGRLRYLPFHMVFIGTCKPADYHRELGALAVRCGIGDRVSFYGFTDRARQLIRGADIGVAPSIVREACPLSPMEFMQAGKCVIATDNGAQPEYIVSGKDGLLVPPGDVDALTSALASVLEDKALRLRLGRQARVHFEADMNYSRFVQSVLEVYR